MFLTRKIDTENVVHYTIEYYTAIKTNEIKKFTDKWMELVNILLSEGSQT